MIKKLLLITYSFLFVNWLQAQPGAFEIVVEPVAISGLAGIQSFAYGQAEGKWLIVGGRTDGLHRRQPFAAFNENGKNTELIVIDPVGKKKWTAPLSALSVSLQEQLGSTNMQFQQQADILYIAGGYGYSASMDEHITFGKLAAIDVSKTINAIINNESVTDFIRQITDEKFAVTGGHLNKIYDTYYLVGGQKFTGLYNPMGPNHGPGFVQQYTDQIRKFGIKDDGVNISITDYQLITDSLAFHRRDYNVIPQILTNGKEGLTVFSGVFQTVADIPFLNSVDIDNDGYSINNSFAQYYNHYHCAVLPMYSQHRNEMHNIFFGGIAHYYDSSGTMVQNSDVPFVKSISRVTRDNSGKLAEYKLPVSMPSLLGAGSELILFPGIPQYPNEVIKFDSLTNDTTLIGHIFGGISSKIPNVFWVNTGKESKASNQLFKVYLIKNTEKQKDKLNAQSNNGLQMQVYSNTPDAILSVKYFLSVSTDVELQIRDANKKIIKNVILKRQAKGENTFHKNIPTLKGGKQYWVTLKTAFAQSTQKIIIEP